MIPKQREEILTNLRSMKEHCDEKEEKLRNEMRREGRPDPLDVERLATNCAIGYFADVLALLVAEVTEHD